MRRTSALIVGGGPAGATAATLLARAGLAPVVLERERTQGDPLCGGFLSWATLRRLARLGLDLDRLGGAPVERLALFAGARSAGATLPAGARGVSRRRLDAALLALAADAGAGVERGMRVRAIEPGRVQLDGGAWLAGDRVVLATGKHDLRGHGRPAPHADPAVGLRWRLAPTPRLRRLVGRTIELHLFRGGYAGLVMQEDGANLCLATRRGRLRAADNQPDGLLAALADECPALAARLDAAAAVTSPDAVANVPYGWRAQTGEDAYRVGDQAGVIPSLAGEGLAIAVASGEAASDAILRGTAPAAFQPALARRLRRPIRLAALLWHAAEHPLGARALVAATAALPALARLTAGATRVGGDAATLTSAA